MKAKEMEALAEVGLASPKGGDGEEAETEEEEKGDDAKAKGCTHFSLR